MTANAQPPQAAPTAPQDTDSKKARVFFFKCHVTFDKYCMRIANNRPLPGYKAVVIKVTPMQVTTAAHHELPLDIFQCWLNSLPLEQAEFTKAHTDALNLQRDWV